MPVGRLAIPFGMLLDEEVSVSKETGMSLRVGFLGLGTMGSIMASKIGSAGFPLWVYNRTRSKAEEFKRRNTSSILDSPAELASACNILITMVSDDNASERLYMGPAGILEAIHPGTICLEMSTVGPETIQKLVTALELRGARLVDAPVSGSVDAARNSQLLIMAGGSAEDLERARPVLNVLASRVLHVGPVGTGSTMKLAVNAIVYALSQALSEALVLVEKAGVERTAAYEVFASSAIAAPFVHYRRAAFERPGEIPVAFRLALAQKDMNLVLSLANRVRAPMPQAEINFKMLEAAASSGFRDHDMSAVAEYLRTMIRT
jgi:3-hydroxyisobutyrate dehydrogenase-like beta-hydroxyacid dehydrogenase